jgi:hypothetical protein
MSWDEMCTARKKVGQKKSGECKQGKMRGRCRTTAKMKGYDEQRRKEYGQQEKGEKAGE